MTQGIGLVVGALCAIHFSEGRSLLGKVLAWVISLCLAGMAACVVMSIVAIALAAFLKKKDS